MARTEIRLRFPFWAAALLIGVLARLYSGVLVALAAHTQTPTPWTGDPVTYSGMTMMWDGTWYRGIAEEGYPAVLPVGPDGALQQNAWAFYPLFPLLCRLVMTLTGLEFRYVGGTLALLLSLLATVLVATYLHRLMSARGALLATAAWACFFATPVFNLAYTESLAVVLLAAFLLLVDDRRWWAAAGVALLVGLSRPIAVPLGVVAVVAVAHRWWSNGRRLERGELVPMAATVASCGIAGFTWPAIAWAVTGSRSAYTDTMTTWRAVPEIVPFRPWYDNFGYFFGSAGPWLLLGAVVGWLVVALGPWAWRLPWTAHAWIIAYPLYLGAVLDPISSTYRYLIPLFPVAGLLVGLHRRYRSWQALVGVVLVLLGCVTQVWWVSTFLVYHPPQSWPP